MPLALAAWLLGLPLLAVMLFVSRRGGTGSAREDSRPTASGAAGLDGDAAELADSIGWPYWYGAGTPATPWADGAGGVDCSGYAQMALVRLGLLDPSAPDRSAASLADDSDPLEVGEQRPGDLAYYPGHVMVVASSPGGDGHSAVIGASGGHVYTFGNDPDARVKVFDSALYRDDFVTYMRLRG